MFHSFNFKISSKIFIIGKYNHTHLKQNSCSFIIFIFENNFFHIILIINNYLEFEIIISRLWSNPYYIKLK